MKGFVLLSGEDIDLANGELRGAMRSMGSDQLPVERDQRAIVFQNPLPKGVARRMGFCHFQGRLRAPTSPEWSAIESSILSAVNDLDPNRSVSVKVVSPRTGPLSRSKLFEGSSAILSESGFRVHHQNPQQKLFIVVGDIACVGIIEEEADRAQFAGRSGPRMPFNRSIVVEPKLARVMANLSGLPTGSTVLDPFLGPAGLAIEAARLGFQVVGVERDLQIYQGAEMNIDAQDLSGSITAHHGDSRMISETDWWENAGRIDGIVTDPPFGRSAPLMGETPSRLLQDVVHIVSCKMAPGAPIVADSDQRETFEGISGFRLEHVYPLRVHKSLIRFISVLKKS